MENAAGTAHQPFLFNADDNKLQEFLLLSLFVAGKNAVVQQHKLNWLLEILRTRVFAHLHHWPPLRRVHYLNPEVLEHGYLRWVGSGQYRRLVRALCWLSDAMYGAGLNGKELDLRTCDRDQLVECPGIGYKTASFFLIYTRPGLHQACLDTHILRWLREERKFEDCPATSPQSKNGYLKWESVYLKEAEKMDRNPTELDFELWLRYSKKKK